MRTLNLTQFFAILLSCFVISAYAGVGVPYNRIVIFGDSLTDTGNLYRMDHGTMPKSPPYYQGRFTNGEIWVDHITKYFYEKKYISVTNYAVAGETVIFHSPTRGFLPYSLNFSINKYFYQTIMKDRSTTLAVLWIGGNDYLKGSSNVDMDTTNIVNNLRYAIENLILHGIKNVLVVNLPDSSQTPYGKAGKIADVLKALTREHNQKLQKAVTYIESKYHDVKIHLFNISRLFDAALANPDEYNREHHIHLTNIKEACWKGGYFSLLVFDTGMQQKMAADLRDYPGFSMEGNQLSPDQFAAYINESPALQESFRVSKAADEGEKPCDNPDEYFFWDRMHPTKIIYNILAEQMIEEIEKNFTQAA